MGKFIRKISKLKHRKVLCAVLIFVVAATGVSVFFVLNARGQENSDVTTTVQETTAEIGNIGSTIVGTGSLATSDSSNVQVPKGLIIDEIKVESGDSVTAGDVIATVTQASVADTLLDVKDDIDTVEDDIDDLSSDADDTSTTEYLQKLVLESELASLESTEAELTMLLGTLNITAPSDGVISSLNIEEGSAVGSTSSSSSNSSSSSSTDTGSTTGMSTSQKSTAFSFLTAEVVDKVDSAVITTAEASAITTCSELNITAPVTGAIPQSNVAIKENTTANYTGTISWNTSGSKFEENTEYTATIVLTANAGYKFDANVLVELDNAYVYEWNVFGNDVEGNRLRIVAKYAKTAASDTSDQSNENNKSDDTNATDDSNTDTSNGNNSSGTTASGSGSSASTASGTGSSGSASSASASTDTSSSDSSSSSVSTDDLLSTIATISSASEVQVSINVDELDILTVEAGQNATITLDAIEDEEFEGTVSRISSEASSSNSSTKYVVEIVLSRTEDMLLGMSASATINIDEVDDAVLIPVSAIQESDGKIFVYTEKDDDDNLSGEVEIETGISNGSQVQVLSGLSEGDTVYYLKSESTDSSEESMMFGGDMDSGEMPGGGEMPSGGGGEMPSGGGGGGGMPSN